MEYIKKRSFKINQINSSQFDELRNTMLTLPGIRGMNLVEKKGTIVIKYDLGKITMRDIENKIEDSGLNLENGLLSKLRRSILSYSEQNELDNINAPTAPCCSNPKGILNKASK